MFRETLFPLLAVSVVGMIILPLPLPLLDALLIVNLALSLLLLVSVLSVPEPERFTSLPTLLLVSTLFRLGLNVSTTRQILGTGTAPELVQVFGEYAVGGNLVVGTVLFLIITVIQFCVIAKGGERVAEVAARFALDGMPGRQMSIDADIRSGLLTLSEGRTKRLELQRECKLYGALDGAMKFVKGDAIAGLCIIAINIVAGVFLGMQVHSLTFQEALHRFTLFTIGDGLISQIPALLVAVSAGVAVTRVSDEPEGLLSGEIARQLFGQPRALAVVGLLVCVSAFIPGFPIMWGLLCGSVFGLLALVTHVKRRVSNKPAEVLSLEPPPILVTVGAEFARSLNPSDTSPAALREFRQAFFSRWGVLLPELRFRLDSAGVGRAMAIEIFGAPASHQLLDGIEEGAEGYFQRCLGASLEQHLPELIDSGQTRTLLDLYEGTLPDLVQAVSKAPEDVTLLTRVLRELVREGVPIREFRNILQALADYRAGLDTSVGPSRESESTTGAPIVPYRRQVGAIRVNFDELLALVRSRLARSICQQLTDSAGLIRVWVLDPELDYLLARVCLAGIDVAPELAGQIETALRNAAVTNADGLTIVTSRYARSVIARLRRGLPGIQVIASDELLPGSEVHVHGDISLQRLELAA